MFRTRIAGALALAAMVSTTLIWSPAASAAPAAAPAAPAAAAALSCHIVCDGADPMTAVYEDNRGVLVRCRGFQTIYTVSVPTIGQVEFRYSTTCRMAWARGMPGIKIEGFNPNGSLRVIHDAGDSMRQTYTRAVNDAGQTARACVNTPFGDWTCGRRY